MSGRWLDAARQVALFVAAFYLYRLTRGAADDPAAAGVAFENARLLIGVERSLGVFFEPAVQRWAAGVAGLEAVASWLYVNAQTTVTVGALAFLYLRHSGCFYFVRNMFLVAFAIALAGYVAFPTAPPRFLPEWGFHDSVAATLGVGHDSDISALFNPYAAVPSMHVAFALMVGLPLARVSRHRVTRAAWAVYPLLVTFVIVATGNHFVADAVLGAATVAVAAVAARAMARARAGWAFRPVGLSA